MITRKDIADRLGISVSVVSRALNNSGYVQAEKRRQILELAQELGYGREPAALRKFDRNTRKILLYTINTRNPFYVEFGLGINDAAKQLGYTVHSSVPPRSAEEERYEADGIVFASESLSIVGQRNFIPLVSASFGGHRQLPRHVTTIESDLWQGAEKVLEYLWDRGHEKIAMVSPFTMDNPDARLRSWVANMRPILAEKLEKYFIVVSDTARSQSQGSLIAGGRGVAALTAEDFFENGVLAARRFVESGCDATAVVCFNEEMGVGFCKAYRQMGRQIPEDLSVIAYDGTYLRRYFDDPLTVLDLQPYMQGYRCAEIVIDLIRGKKVRNQKVVPSVILEGATVRTLN